MKTLISALTATLIASGFVSPSWAQDKAAPKADAAKADAKGTRPALTVTAVQPVRASLAMALKANGNVAAWQEAVLGAEVNGLKLIAVRADVGDRVKRGQVLAQFSSETTDAEVAQAKAQLAEADAAYAEAKGNADRARPLQSSGALSQQQIAQLLTGEKTAEARVQAARANMSAVQLRLRHTRVVASDDGIISARSATVGAVVPQGMELFRLIRQSRLEWRAEVTAAELKRIEAGQSVLVTSPDGSSAQGRVRKVAPTVDPQTRSGLVYVDLPRDAQGFKAGMFASGAFALGDSSALTLPDQALILRDGFSYAFRIDTGNRVSQVKLRTGRRVGDKVEVLEGVKPEDRFVASGAAFLADGDTVRVTTATTPAAPAPAAPAAPAAAKAAK